MRPFLFFACLCLAIGAKSQLSRTDSLSGFNVAPFALEAHEHRLDQADLRYFIKQKENAYLKKKFNLKQAEAEQPVSRPGQGNTVANAPCVDEDFEALAAGAIASTGWTATTANMANSPVCAGLSSFSNNNATAIVAVTPIIDANCNDVPASPFGGTKVMQLNRYISSINSRIKQTFSVTSTNFIYGYAYKGFSNGAGHPCCDAPSMLFNFYNCSGGLIAALSKTIVPGGNCGPAPAGWNTGTFGSFTPNWIVTVENLASYIGSCITVEVIASNCTNFSHNGYLYYDAKCADGGMFVNDNLVTAPAYTLCAPTATLSGLAGFTSFSWQGPLASGVSGSTSSVVTTGTPGNYTLTASIGTLVTTQTLNLSLNTLGTVSITGNSSVCAAGTVSLQAIGNGLLTYTWTGGAATSSLSLSPASNTVYAVSATNSLGCISNNSINITVFQNTPVNIQSPTLTICRGASVTLLASSNTASSYTWNNGSSASSITVSPIITSTYFATVTTVNSCVSTASVLLTVLVPPVAQIAATSNSLCSGQTVTLSANGTNISSYLWSNQSSAQSLTLAPSVTAVYIVTVTSASGCSDTASTTVTVYAMPQLVLAASPLSLCAGSPVSFSLSGISLGTFLWNDGSTAVNSTQNASLNTIYSVSVTSAEGCMAVAQKTIDVKALPQFQLSVSHQTICTNENVSLSVSGNALTTYNWSNGQTGAAINFAPLQTSTITVSVTGSNGCIATAAKTIVVSACTGIKGFAAVSEPGIMVFPNPTSDAFTIKSNKKQAGSIIDELGRVIREFNLREENSYSQTFSGFASGVYVIKTEKSAVKLIVK